ncbi:unnamed protein product [Protopolystoma xenopodis]|uniref:Uncharacterized protein n=1 Tax=Protopolystoma xenopodis TaxID=117903 RepID=A0A3S5BRD3_9PLAT|nr:unnamed protein product [Protopolystoma xenopodis]
MLTDDSACPVLTPQIGVYPSDSETNPESFNMALMDQPQWSPLPDGGFEVIDTLPKKEYYMSLRRIDGNGTLGNINRLGSITGGSALGTGAIMSPSMPGASSSPLVQMNKDTLHSHSHLGRSQASALDFKPSGKMVDCTVVMLDGSEQVFNLDASLLLVNAFCLDYPV